MIILLYMPCVSNLGPTKALDLYSKNVARISPVGIEWHQLSVKSNKDERLFTIPMTGGILLAILLKRNVALRILLPTYNRVMAIVMLVVTFPIMPTYVPNYYLS